MKRPRSASPGEGGIASDDDDSSAHARTDTESNASLSSASSSLSSRRDSGGEEPEKKPLYALLDTVLALMKPEESFATALRRYSDGGAKAEFDELTDAHTAVHAQHDLVLMPMQREAVLLRATAERAKLGQGPPPPLWFLRWQGSPAVHGPFASEQLQQWAAGGFFEKRSATVRNGSDVAGRWKDAKGVFPRTAESRA